MERVTIGKTDYTCTIKLRNSDGTPATGKAHTDVDIAYTRVETDNDVVCTDVAPASLSALTDAHTDWGFKEISAGDAPGEYRLDVADAVFAAGAWTAIVTVTGTGLDATPIKFQLVDEDPQNLKAGVAAAVAANATIAGMVDTIAAILEKMTKMYVLEGTLAAGSTTGGTFPVGAPSDDGVLDGNFIRFTGGSGAGQTAFVANYNGTTRAFTLKDAAGADKTLPVALSTDTEFIVV